MEGAADSTRCRAPVTARYKSLDTNPQFLAVDLARQLLPGRFEHALNYLLDHEVDLAHFDARFRNDTTGAPAYPPAMLLEGRALARLLGEFPGASGWISFSTRDGAHLANGEPIAEVVQSLGEAPQVVAVGVNCTSPRRIPSLVRELARGGARPIAVYPNSGETYDGKAHAWGGAADDVAFARAAADWYAAGARLIGGCCRTTPDDIRAVAKWRRTLVRS